jgi:hypothetical protein
LIYLQCWLSNAKEQGGNGKHGANKLNSQVTEQIGDLVMIIKEGKQEKEADHQHQHQMETVEWGFEAVNEIELASKSKTTKHLSVLAPALPVYAGIFGLRERAPG